LDVGVQSCGCLRYKEKSVADLLFRGGPPLSVNLNRQLGPVG